ncbi:hypothetical protein GCM10011366_11450 [Ornithinimicrobium tianjinense]|uniref:Uncharacterized protein n=1 Tax=Ornithinimicrobium tianjinense TaxID=1195761 RepID=A0A917BIJ9_9MICO|nr:hypothetical protein GCM10011366_11450 [Ornithinimicrobium tianjinense]
MLAILGRPCVLPAHTLQVWRARAAPVSGSGTRSAGMACARHSHEWVAHAVDRDGQMTPIASIASATWVKPEALAPKT